MLNANDTKERRQAIATLADLIHDIPVAMLTTRGEDGTMHSRPMVNINRDFDGDLCFFTLADDPKVFEIAKEPHVNLCFSSPSQHRYVSIAGTASVQQDQKKIELLWTDDVAQWFPADLDKQQLALIQISIEHAEYWDTKHRTMLALAGLVRRILTGDPRRLVENEEINWK